MGAITFDTLKFSKRLRDAGYSEQQAEATVEAQKEMLSEVLDTTLAIRDDIHGIEARIAKIKVEITSTKWIMGVILGGIVALLIKAFIK